MVQVLTYCGYAVEGCRYLHTVVMPSKPIVAPTMLHGQAARDRFAEKSSGETTTRDLG